MRYDFDMCYVNNPASDSVIVSGVPQVSSGKLEANHIVATFRDSRTIEAIMAAPPIIRLFLEEAGFELKCASQRGLRRPKDPQMKQLLVEQLADLLSNRAMKKALSRAAHESDFDLHAFIAFVTDNDPTERPIRKVANTTSAPTNPHVMPRRPSDLEVKASRRRARPV